MTIRERNETIAEFCDVILARVNSGLITGADDLRLYLMAAKAGALNDCDHTVTFIVNRDKPRLAEWYTPEIEAAHQILLEAADQLDTTERRLAHNDLEQALSNLYALRIHLDKASALLSENISPNHD